MSMTGEAIRQEAERRLGTDRRRHRPRTLLCSFYMQRRRHVRRCQHAGDYYLDVVERRVILAALAIMLLSCTDSVFTLTLLQRGAQEVNPLMRYLLEIDTTAFIGGKLLITAAGVLFLVAHGHFRLFRVVRGRHVLYALLGVYLTLFNYQVALLGN